MDHPQQTTSDNPPTSPPGLVISGKKLVLGLLGFGSVLTLLMFVYWEQHTRPFRPLREELGRQFRHTRPVVEGGRAKGKGPWTLRITMTVDFPPGEDTVQANQLSEQIRQVVHRHAEIKEMEQLELNLIQFVPQEVAKTKSFTWTAEEVRANHPSEPKKG